MAQVILWGIREQTSHQTKPSLSKIPIFLDQRATRGIQVNTRIKDHSTSQILIQTRHISEEIDVPSVEILNMLKVLNVLQRKVQCKIWNKYRFFTSLCYNNISLKSRNPKAHPLWVGVVYVQEDSICDQFSDLTSNDESSANKWKYSAHKLNPGLPYLIISSLILPTDWIHTTRETSTWEPDRTHVLK